MEYLRTRVRFPPPPPNFFYFYYDEKKEMLKSTKALSFFVILVGFTYWQLGSPILAQETKKAEPAVMVELRDVQGGTRLKISADTNLIYSLKKEGNTLIISIKTPSGLKIEKKPFSSQFITSVDLAKSPESYFLMVKARTDNFDFSQSARWNPLVLTIELKLREAKPTPVMMKSDRLSEKPADKPASVEKTTIEKNSIQTEVARRRIKTIVIDPGHGGNESGAKGIYGTLEKDITLNISKKLKETIERGLKYRVVMTRDADVVVPLERRAAIANNNKADLFISIHINGSRRVNARGSETFFLNLNATDEEARRLAYFENNSEELGGQVPESDFDDLKLILWDMAQSAYLKQSSQLAEFVQLELNELLRTQNRGIKQAPFKVLTGVACPAILVEVAFITNPEEEKILSSEDFQARVAEAIYRALNRFLQLYERP
ncbi:MAG: N-acetylmuramoyl-L-alanine amidase [Acidobacteriota bacterium]|nr:N-acetylmuramoyl-L-alanine amidase [Acidobacteriota bacterium]MDW3228230.1 N-acetylmuramoyl-L-alanine amidase [Acidobacteriota bacterium]MDY0231490.1 N-acetylmuramoyl-L-alanine amidase [Candidatus Saccharicenans sp.]